MPEDNLGGVTGNVTTPAPTSEKISGGTNGAATPVNWIAGTFSEQFRNQHYDKFKSFKDADALGSSYLELQNKMSSTGRLPNETATPEEWNQYYKSWGRPENPDGYKLTDELSKNPLLQGENDKAFLGAVSNVAHQLGLNNKQYEQLITWGTQQRQAQMDAEAAEIARGITGLKSEWGYAYDGNVKLAQAALSTMVNGNANHPIIKLLDSSGLSNNPTVIKFFYDIGKELGEDELIDGKLGTVAQQEDAKTRIGAIRGDEKHPYNNPQHPLHKQAVAEVEALYKEAYA